MNKFYFLCILLYLSYPFYSHAQEASSLIPINIDLDKAMKMSENYSFPVKTADSEQTNAQRQKIFAVTQMGPSVNITGTTSWYDQSNTLLNVNNHGESSSSSALSVTATQPVTKLISGAMKIEQTSAASHASQLNLTAEKIKARLAGAKAYITVQQALRTLEAKKAATKFAYETYYETQILFETGSIEKTKIDVLQTKAEAASARLAEISAQKDLQAALINLGAKIGVNNIAIIHVELEEKSIWEKTNPKIPELEPALAKALEQHPEINATLENNRAARLRLDQTYFNYLPQVNLFATYSKSSQDTSSLYFEDIANTSLTTNTNQFFYGISLNWALWDGGVQAAQISQNLNEKTKTAIENEQAAQNVTQDVQNSFNDLNAAIKSLNDANEAAKNYEESYKMATVLYKTGNYSAINLIETQNKMTFAQVTLANVRSELDFSWMKLQAALGKFPQTTTQ